MSITPKGIFCGAILLLQLFFLGGCVTSRPGARIQREVAGKTYVIVGASSGFGRGVAEQLGQYKANVVLAARSTGKLEEVASIIRAAGGRATVVTTDISKPEEVQRLADSAVRHFGKIDVWVNASGIGAIGYFWEIPLEDQARIIDINLKGFIYASHAALKQFRAQGYGTLVNFGSVESKVPLAYHTTYAATKAGILSLGLSLNEELRLSGNKNIRVVTIEPWAVDTPFWTHTGNYTERTTRMIALDPPRKVVNAVIRRSIRRTKEVPVGGKAKAASAFHRLAPHLTIKVSANIVKMEIKKGMPTPNTSGSIHKPMRDTLEVEGGVRARMKRENRERKARR